MSLLMIIGCSRNLGTDVIELGPERCGTTEAFGDNFDDGAVGAGWRASDPVNGGVVGEQGGLLVLKPLDVMGNATGLTTLETFDLEGSSVVVEVTQVVQSTPQAWVQLQLITPGPTVNILRLHFQDGSICASYLLAGAAFVTPACVPYDPARHRWWQIREAAGQISWRLGADRSTAQVLYAQAAPFDVNSVYVQLEAGTAGAVAGVGEAHFDNLNPQADPPDGTHVQCPPGPGAALHVTENGSPAAQP